MAKLTSSERNSLPTKVFALPKKRKYPIPDKSHAVDALSRASANATPSEEATIRHEVAEEFPGIKQRTGKRILRKKASN